MEPGSSCLLKVNKTAHRDTDCVTLLFAVVEAYGSSLAQSFGLPQGPLKAYLHVRFQSAISQ